MKIKLAQLIHLHNAIRTMDRYIPFYDWINSLPEKEKSDIATAWRIISDTIDQLGSSEIKISS